MSERIELNGLNVAVELQHFIETQALPGTGVDPNAFWSGLADIVTKLGPKNAALLKKRADLVTWFLIIRRSAPFQAEKAGIHSPIIEHRIIKPLT